MSSIRPDGKKAIDDSLFAHLSPTFRESSFIFHAKSNTFIRQHQDRSDRFQLVSLNAKPGSQVQPNVGVRYDQVEEIFHETSGFEKKYQTGTMSIGSSIGNILANDNTACEFIIRTLADVDSAATGIVRMFYDFAIPFFERFSSLSAVDEELNSDPSRRTPNRPIPWTRCSSGVIVAKLAGRPNYDEVVNVYRNEMTRSDRGFYLPRFEALVKSLERERTGH